jgi:Fur family ferric uptake transcriptional regulator
MSDLEQLTLKLESRGYRVTPPRRVVIAAILQQSDHFSVDDLLKRCRRGAGRATVFRTLRLLVEMGVVCRVLLEDGTMHYRVSQRGHHHHLVCTACGKVEDLDQCTITDTMRELAQSTGYDIEGHWLELYGRCAECRAAVPAEAVTA